MNIFTKRGYRQLVEVPTRGDNILDLVFVDDSTLITGISVEGLFSTSDHCVVLADLSLGIKKSRKFYKRWHSGSYDVISDCLSVHDWRLCFECDHSDVNVMYQIFVNACQELILMFVPSKVIKNGPPQSFAVKRALKDKLRCHRAHKRERTESSFEKLNTATAAVAEVIKSENVRFEMSVIQDSDVKKFYGWLRQ